MKLIILGMVFLLQAFTDDHKHSVWEIMSGDGDEPIVCYKRVHRNYYVGASGFLLAFALLAYSRYRLKLRVSEKLEKQNREIARKNKDILDSINYARRIQEAIFPSGDVVKNYLPNSFVLYKPKDIVSGDFFWVEKSENKVLFAAVDCTGHGVPGAFMSIVGYDNLNKIVNEQQITGPGKILDQLNKNVKKTLSKTEETSLKDGMDIALCAISSLQADTGAILRYSGAYNPLYIVRNKKLIEVKADKMPIGNYLFNAQSFTEHEIELEAGDMIYIFSDGYADQFGGPKGKKFKYRQFKELLASIADAPIEDQKKILDETIRKWQGNAEQVDDILIIGVKI